RRPSMVEHRLSMTRHCGEVKDESGRAFARDAALADFEAAGAGRADAWVRDCALDSADFAGRAAGGRGVVVSGAAADVGQGVGEGGVGGDGGEPACAVLPVDGGGEEAAGGGDDAI